MPLSPNKLKVDADRTQRNAQQLSLATFKRTKEQNNNKRAQKESSQCRELHM